MIEPARAGEIAPIITRAYGLSRARGARSPQLIAQGVGHRRRSPSGCSLSTHTVRDYVKAIFEKVGVSSRGALVATLFAEHYAPLHTDPAAHHRI